MSLGEIIRKARIDNKLSQKDLAEAISNEEETFGNTTISNWENNLNKPDADTIASLCRVLNLDANYLLGIQNSESEIGKNEYTDNSFSELEVLFNKNKDILTEDDKETIKFLIEKRKREIDKELGEE